MERYLYIQSDESDAYFSDNEVYRFKVHLNMPLTLSGKWAVGLTEFNAVEVSKSRTKSTDSLYVYTDLCKESIVHGEEQPLLRRVDKNKKNGWDYMFNVPYYLPAKKKELREFQIYIKLADGTYPSDLKSPLNLTLHLKQYPFY
jgi:hypothetical protein